MEQFTVLLNKNGQGVVPMFGWFKSERRERQKKVKQDRKHLEERVRRFLKGYLVQRFDGLNHIRLLRRVCMTRCG
jgi:hypothetical protein